MKNLKKVSNIQEEETGSKEDIVNGNKRSPYLILDLQQYFFTWVFFHGHKEKEGNYLYSVLSLSSTHQHAGIYLNLYSPEITTSYFQ